MPDKKGAARMSAWRGWCVVDREGRRQTIVFTRRGMTAGIVREYARARLLHLKPARSRNGWRVARVVVSEVVQ